MTAPDGVVIRRAVEHELDRVGLLARHANEHDLALSAEYLAEIEDARGRAESAELWVAEDAVTGGLLGTVTLPRPGERLQSDTEIDELDVRLLAVAPEARGRGLGEALMRHAIEVARDRGAVRLVLHTADAMLGARRLYERMGFVRLRDREALIRESPEAGCILAYGYEVSGTPDQRESSRQELNIG